MEKHLDEAAATIAELNAALDRYIDAQIGLIELEEYYSSPQWLEDYDADCVGLIPKDLKRGVLSQDAVYNLLCENREVLEKIKKLSEQHDEL